MFLVTAKEQVVHPRRENVDKRSDISPKRKEKNNKLQLKMARGRHTRLSWSTMATMWNRQTKKTSWRSCWWNKVKFRLCVCDVQPKVFVSFWCWKRERFWLWHDHWHFCWPTVAGLGYAGVYSTRRLLVEKSSVGPLADDEERRRKEERKWTDLSTCWRPHTHTHTHTTAGDTFNSRRRLTVYTCLPNWIMPAFYSLRVVFSSFFLPKENLILLVWKWLAYVTNANSCRLSWFSRQILVVFFYRTIRFSLGIVRHTSRYSFPGSTPSNVGIGRCPRFLGMSNSSSCSVYIRPYQIDRFTIYTLLLLKTYKAVCPNWISLQTKIVEKTTRVISYV